jgi:hypothetical protein
VQGTKAIVGASPAFVLALMFAPADDRVSAGECTGKACQDIVIKKVGDCIVIENTGDRPVVVKPTGAVGVSFGTVYAHSTFKPTLPLSGNQCLSTYNYDYTAVYEGGSAGDGCEKIRPLRELGYGNGHKSRFCRRKGYEGMTNFPHSDSHDYGGGFCYTGDAQACLNLVKGYPK